MTFYNTTHELGRDRARFEGAAERQEDLVEAWFRRCPNAVVPPHDVQRHVLPAAPLTSVRRVLTDLTSAGVLEKTTTRVPGPYGRPCYCWRLRPAPTDEAQLPLL